MAIQTLRRLVRHCLKGAGDVVRKIAAGDLRLTRRPDHLLSTADIRRGTFRIERMDELAYRKSVHLDADRPRQFHSRGLGIWDVAIEDLPQLTNSIEGLGNGDLCIISHPGFCGSTLMANLLEDLPAFFVYREPVVWRRITDLIYEPGLAHKYSKPQLDEIILAVLRLFSRTWLPHKKAVVKSIPGAMGLDFYAHRLVPSIRYVYLAPGLKSYLASIYRDQDQRFRWIDEQLEHEWLWLHSGHPRDRLDLRSLPRHLRAALHWKLHAAAMARFSADRPGAVLTISSSEFFQDKARVIREVATHFGRPPGNGEIQRLLQSGISDYYSKDRSRKYDDEDRVRERSALLARHQAEIDEAVSWLSGI